MAARVRRGTPLSKKGSKMGRLAPAQERLKGCEMDAVGKQKQPPELEQPHERAEILDICLQKQCQYIMFQQLTCAVWE